MFHHLFVVQGNTPLGLDPTVQRFYFGNRAKKLREHISLTPICYYVWFYMPMGVTSKLAIIPSIHKGSAILPTIQARIPLPAHLVYSSLLPHVTPTHKVLLNLGDHDRFSFQACLVLE